MTVEDWQPKKKKLKADYSCIQLKEAKSQDLAIVQNLAQFYMYEFNLPLTQSGRYSDIETLPLYWKEKDRHPYLIYLKEELAGFVLINKLGSTPEVDWNIGEFFIIRKFQGEGIGTHVACLCFDKFPGIWEVMVIPENQGACSFWRKTISDYSRNNFIQSTKKIHYKGNEERVVFRFSTNSR